MRVRFAFLAALVCTSPLAAQRLGAPHPSKPISPDLARQLEGRYLKADRVVYLVERDGRLFVRMPQGVYQSEVRLIGGDTLVVDDAVMYGPQMRVLAGNQLVIGVDTFGRAPSAVPADVPGNWRGLIGEYGRERGTLYVMEREAKLYALLDAVFMYPLQEVSRDVYMLPLSGPYDRIVFKRNAAGRATEAEAGSVVFKRRLLDIENGQTFKIKPLRPVEELRREALAATPPVERGKFRQTDLVELRSLDPTIKYDIRYASTNNFMDAVFYSEAKAFLQRPAAEALVSAHRKLRDHGYGLFVHDAYRPWYVTKMFFDATPQEHKHFVADPSLGSRHNRGAAVDLTLYDLKTGQPVEMVGGYDEFSERSYPEYPGGTTRQRWHRELLRDAMEAEGFRVYEFEWWHFDYGDWRKYPIGNLTFDRIGR